MLEFAVVIMLKQKLDCNARDKPKPWSNLELRAERNNLSANNIICTTEAIGVIENRAKTCNTQEKLDGNQRDNTQWLFGELSLTRKVDFVAFIMFTFGYFLYNCYYWMHYTTL